MANILMCKQLILTLVGWVAGCELHHKTHSGRTSPGCEHTPKSEALRHSANHEKIAHRPMWSLKLILHG